jgi:hypothetical protein
VNRITARAAREGHGDTAAQSEEGHGDTATVFLPLHFLHFSLLHTNPLDPIRVDTSSFGLSESNLRTVWQKQENTMFD